MKSFDHYEFTGIVVPGALAVIGISLLYPELRPVFLAKDITVGSLGIFIILAYIAGHLLQAIGNVIESVWWKLFLGIPTDWVRSKKDDLIASAQFEALEISLQRKLGLQGPIKMGEIDRQAWFSITRQIYAAVSAQSRAGRVDIFNGNYGLNRGIASGFLFISVLIIANNLSYWPVALGTLAGAIIALYRMHRFAKLYAIELFVQFLQLP
ncbi:hypothetical protein PTH_2400 [Pelotomaculum thermopropionicum SI]|uniref:Uncharacterized protein n=1 Tax=Pelotomaculum thermopropionicum (strain DSM 13744 / JCM 10971 / SI) TaxID=370438 RepID=A5CZL8_PELTS|nr:hypothetical protein PTH_2400 [Pelotomaculum thermopropionicum SI]